MRPKYLSVAKFAGLGAVLMTLTGCENPYMQQFREEFGWNEARMVSDGWLKGRQIPVEPRYCYDTLGDADCFAEAKKGEEHRLLAKPDMGGF